MDVLKFLKYPVIVVFLPQGKKKSVKKDGKEKSVKVKEGEEGFFEKGTLVNPGFRVKTLRYQKVQENSRNLKKAHIF